MRHIPGWLLPVPGSDCSPLSFSPSTPLWDSPTWPTVTWPLSPPTEYVGPTSSEKCSALRPSSFSFPLWVSTLAVFLSQWDLATFAMVVVALKAGSTFLEGSFVLRPESYFVHGNCRIHLLSGFDSSYPSGQGLHISNRVAVAVSTGAPLTDISETAPCLRCFSEVVEYYSTFPLRVWFPKGFLLMVW